MNIMLGSVLILVAFTVSVCHGGELCNAGGDVIYCSNGCCGTVSNAYCCWDPSIVIGLILGGIILISIIVTVVLLVRHFHRKKQQNNVMQVRVQEAGQVSTVGPHPAGGPQPSPFCQSGAPPMMMYPGHPAYPPTYPPPAKSTCNSNSRTADGPQSNPFSFMPYNEPAYPPPPPPGQEALYTGNPAGTNVNSAQTSSRLPTAQPLGPLQPLAPIGLRSQVPPQMTAWSSESQTGPTTSENLPPSSRAPRLNTIQPIP